MAANLKELAAPDVHESIKRLLAAATHEQQVRFALHCALSVQGYLTLGSKEQVAAKAATDLVAAWLENPKKVSREKLRRATNAAADAAFVAAKRVAAPAAYAAADAAYVVVTATKSAADAAYAAAYAAAKNQSNLTNEAALSNYRLDLVKQLSSNVDSEVLGVLYGNN